MKTHTAPRGIAVTVMAGAAVVLTAAWLVAQRAPALDAGRKLDYRTSQSMATYRAPVYPDDVYIRMPLQRCQCVPSFQQLQRTRVTDLDE